MENRVHRECLSLIDIEDSRALRQMGQLPKKFERHEVSNASGLNDKYIDTVYAIGETRPTLEKIRTGSHIPANEWVDLIAAMG